MEGSFGNLGKFIQKIRNIGKLGNISVLAALARQMKVSSTSIKRNNFHFVNTDISSVYQQFTQQVLCITLPIPIIVANFNRLVLPSQI